MPYQKNNYNLTTRSGVSPCKDCKPELGCHSTCQKYIEWKANYEAEKERVNAAKKKEYALNGMIVAVKEKARKGRYR